MVGKQELLSGMKALITDGRQRSALAVTRALGKSGMDVYVAETERSSLAGSSKYCKKQLVYPSPYSDARSFVEAISKLVRQEQPDLVIPIADLTTSLIAEHKKTHPTCDSSLRRLRQILASG